MRGRVSTRQSARAEPRETKRSRNEASPGSLSPSQAEQGSRAEQVPVRRVTGQAAGGAEQGRAAEMPRAGEARP